MRTSLVLTALLFVSVAQVQAQSPSFITKDLSGFDGLIDQYWTYRDGAIIGFAPNGLKFNTFLCTKKKYKDFELSFQVWLTGKNPNSGVQIRSEIADNAKFAVRGPQCDMGGIYWGSLYGELFGGMMQAADKDVVAKVLKKDDFNDYSIRCVGKHVTIKLNGATTVDADFPKMPEDGIIAFQLHAGPPMMLVYRNIEFKDLSMGGTPVTKAAGTKQPTEKTPVKQASAQVQSKQAPTAPTTTTSNTTQGTSQGIFGNLRGRVGGIFRRN